MSAIGAIYNFGDGAPVDPQDVTFLSDGLAGRGPDGNAQYVSKNVGVCYRPFHTTCESHFERQPIVSPQGDVFIMDGIVFNREELISLLSDDLRDDHTDAELVSVGLQKYGTDFLAKVIGNFALVWWNARTRTLHLARDPFGVRPLFYHVSGGRIIVASDLKALLDAAKTMLEIDDEYVAGHLALLPELGRTPYKNFHALEPGHVILMHNGQLKERRFWGPDPHKEIRYKRDTEYEEHLLHVLYDGVRCCLRTDDRPIWTSLSGGLDSSAIVCIADQLIEHGEAEAKRLDTFSIVYDESTTADERKFIRVVEEKRGKAGYHLHDDEYWMRFPPPEKSFLCMPSSLHCAPGRSERQSEEMGKSGARVILNGLGGDQLFWSMWDASPELADLLAQRKLLQLHRRLRIWSQAFTKSYLQLFWKQGLLPLLPRGIRSLYQPKLMLAPWLNRQFINRMHMRERLLRPHDQFGFSNPSGRIQAAHILQLIMITDAGAYLEKEHAELRYPFLHRPLVEFLLAIPFEQKSRPSESRSLMRRALRDILPAKILRRKSKGIVGEALKRGIARERSRLEQLFVDARVCSLGYADSDALRSALQLTIHGGKVDIGAMLNTISLEIWLRSVEHYGVLARGASECMHSLITSGARARREPVGYKAIVC